MESAENAWKSVLDLVSELKLCDEHGITTASAAMSFVCIDALANLSRPKDKARVTRADFKEWVDKHLKADPEQPYQYRGKDVYAARCALLHSYGSESEVHQEDAETIKFAYHDGGRHQFDKSVEPRLVIIGTKSFVNDVVHAVVSFLNECRSDASLKARVEPRLSQVLQTFPYPSR